MRHLAAYLLLVSGGNASPTAEDVKTALSAVGIDADEERLNQLIGELSGKEVETLINDGRSLLVQMGRSGGSAAPAASAASAAGGAAPEAKKEKPKEEEVDALEGGMDMFGGGGGGGGDY